MLKSAFATALAFCLFATSAIAADDAKIDFARDIEPILSASCVRCHGRGQAKGGLKIDTRETLLAGGDSGAAVIEGKSGESLLIELVSGADPDRIMPAQGTKLSPEQVDKLRAWIDQGLAWPEGFTFARPEVELNLALKSPELPAPASDTASTNPIDLLLQTYFAAHSISAQQPVNDRTFARRAYQDVVGLPPTPAEIESFVADTSPDKRERLVNALLADRRRYAEHWMTFWNDALRNDYRGTGYIDGGRKQITAWLFRALLENKPYDQFVRELVNPNSESEGFSKGIVWRGVVNASQVPEMQAAQNIGQIFLGSNLKCASCHDSFVNAWKLSDTYALAAIYADSPLEMHQCDKPTGAMAEPGFLFPALGAVDPEAPKSKRLEQLAELLTKPENGLFARTIVNRLWDRLFGRGLVEPVDEMENEPWNAELLDWLAADFVAHGYDVKHTLRVMLTSRAYELPAVGGKADDEDFVFRGPLVKRLGAEQLVDAVAQLTGVWQTNPATSVLFEQLAQEAAGGSTGPARFASGIVREGAVEIDVDVTGAETLWLIVTNGNQGTTYDWADWCEPELVVGDKTVRLTDLPWTTATSGHEKPQIDKNVVGGPLGIDGREAKFGIGTHGFSVIQYKLPVGATRFRATAGPDNGATQSKVGHEMEFLVLTDVPVRAVMVPADSLMKALGRPNREQVVTRRPTATTTLEALELNNGAILDESLKRGAARWVARFPDDSSQLTTSAYLTALGRAPTPEELVAACELLGEKPTPEGVADLLWALVMLPEFQLIY